MAKAFGEVLIGKAALMKSEEWVQASLADDQHLASIKNALDRFKSGLADIYAVGHFKFMREGLFPACPELDVAGLPRFSALWFLH